MDCTVCSSRLVNLTALAAAGGAGLYLYRYGSGHGWSLAKPDPETMGITALVAGDFAAFFSAYNPSIMTAGAFRRKGGQEAENSKRDLYRGAFVGTVLGTAVAAGGSMVTGSWWPVVAGLAVGVVQWAILIYTVKNPWGETGSIASQPPGGMSAGKGYS